MLTGSRSAQIGRPALARAPIAASGPPTVDPAGSPADSILRPGGLELTGRAVDLCAFRPGDTVLDVGCGYGATVEGLRARGLNAYGLDRSPALFAKSKERKGTPSVFVGDAAGVPLRSDTLDGVFCECVLSILIDTSPALREFHRILRRGGRLVVTDLYARSAEGPDSLASRDKVERSARAAGFELLLWEDHSRELARWAAGRILAGATLEELWTRTSCCNWHAPAAKPGYYLLIAERRPEALGSDRTEEG